MKNYKIKVHFWFSLFLWSIIYFLIVSANLFMNKIEINLESLIQYEINQDIVLVSLLLGVVCYPLIIYLSNNENGLGSEKIFGDNKLLKSSSTKDMESVKGKFIRTKWSDLKLLENPGIVVGTKFIKNKQDAEIIMIEKEHGTLLGITGSGKSESFYSPTLEAFAESKGKPSVVITDVKKDLFNQHSANMKAKGYEIVKIDLRDPEYSNMWNPLYAIAQHVKYLVEGNELIEPNKFTHYKRADHQLKFNNDNLDDEQSDKYSKIIESFKALDIRDQQNSKIAYEKAWAKTETQIAEIAEVLFPKTKDNDYFTGQAKNTVQGIMNGMIYDYQMGLLDYEEINIGNIAESVTSSRPEDLDSYRLQREKFGNLKSFKFLAEWGNTAAEKQVAATLGTLSNGLQLFNDATVRRLTNKNSVDLTSLSDKSVALFIIIPDNEKSKDKLVSVLIAQVYSSLVSHVQFLQDQKKTFNKRVYFLLDELGNVPSIGNLENILTIGRSRGLHVLMGLQALDQMDRIYGKNNTSTILTNSYVIYVKSQDHITLDWFMKRCGYGTRTSKSISNSKDKKGSQSVSESLQKIEAVPYSFLQQLPTGQAVIKKHDAQALLTTAEYFRLFKPMNKYAAGPVPESDFEINFDDIKNTNLFNTVSEDEKISEESIELELNNWVTGLEDYAIKHDQVELYDYCFQKIKDINRISILMTSIVEAINKKIEVEQIKEDKDEKVIDELDEELEAVENYKRDFMKIFNSYMQAISAL